MSHVTRSFSNLVLLVLTFSVVACALFEDRPGPPQYYGPREKVYNAPFDEVWRATNLVLQPYPLKVSNMDQGNLETDTIRVGKVWTAPYKNDSVHDGESYHLTIRVVRGALKGSTATKVNIVKDAEMQTDFFSDPKTVASDGLEENAILYRIGREITIERALARAQKNKNMDKPRPEEH